MAKLSERAQRLRDAGYKLTNARLTVLNVLEATHDHLTSADVLEAVSNEDPSIGRASVFRTLDLLTRMAIIRPTYIDNSVTPSYVLLPEGHHHHIICINCHRVIEFKDCGLSQLAQQLEAEFDVKLSGHLLEFYGVCAECRQNGVTDEE